MITAPFDITAADTTALDTGGLPAGTSFAYFDDELHLGPHSRPRLELLDRAGVERYQRLLGCDDAAPSATSFPEL